MITTSAKNSKVQKKEMRKLSTPDEAQIVLHLKRANEVAKLALANGFHPFGAILVAPDHRTVLLEQGNLNQIRHAESELAQRAFNKFSPAELWECTIYSTVEPCAMCSGAQYWANIGRLVYGVSETELLKMTGASSENPTMDVPSRYVFEHSQKQIEVIGPVAAVRDEIVELHQGFWTE